MILIVDQNREGRDGVCRLLSRVGYRVECVGTGAEAMAYLRMVRPSAVLMPSHVRGVLSATMGSS